MIILLSISQAAKDVVLAEKPVISDGSNLLDPSLLDELLANIATLASVYHKPPDTFVTRVKTAVQRPDEDEYLDGSETGFAESSAHAVDSTSAPSSSSNVSNAATMQAPPTPPAPAAPVPDLLGDLIGLDGALVPVDQPAATPSGSGFQIADFFIYFLFL